MAAKGRWRMLAGVVSTRQRQLGLSQQELAIRAGISPATLRKLQAGSATGVRERTLARVSEALDWPADALARVLEGEAPPRRARRVAASATTLRLVALVDRLAPHEVRAVHRLVEELVRGPRPIERRGA